MFLILSTQIGGAFIFTTFNNMLWNENWPGFVSRQLSWETQSVSFINIAQSIFVFVVGLVIPFSLTNRLLRTDKKRIYLHIIKRALILFLLGLIAGGKLLNLPDYNRTLANIPVYNNVLEYISISYLVCAILVLNTSKLSAVYSDRGISVIGLGNILIHTRSRLERRHLFSTDEYWNVHRKCCFGAAWQWLWIMDGSFEHVWSYLDYAFWSSYEQYNFRKKRLTS